MAVVVAEPPPPPPSASPPLPCTAPKTILARYQQGKLLGRGSFAKVYHARSLTTNKSVAIKIIDKSKTHPSMEPRIVGEVAAMRRLNHPNILKIHEVLATKTKIYLVMELAKGGDLFGKLSRRHDHRFPEPLARKYFHQLVSALQYCHQKGVAHRDVKPQNLLLDEEGNIKVSDFGLSAVSESSRFVSEKDFLLQTSCGTPAFAAPEIVGKTRNGYDGPKADAWSCGVILFVMLTGYLPFDDANLVMMYRKMHKREFRFPSWVSKPARSLITKLLDPNPKTRMSIESIESDSWFKNSGMVYPRSVSLGDMASLEEKKYDKIMLLERSHTMARCDERVCGESETTMNAFELISMSNGLDLSGLFDGEKREKRFTSRVAKKVVVEKVGEVGEGLGYEVEKREKCGGGSCCVWLGKGRFIVSVTVSEVAAELVVVEMKVVDGSGVGWQQEEVYWEELKSGLGDIVVSWHQ